MEQQKHMVKMPVLQLKKRDSEKKGAKKVMDGVEKTLDKSLLKKI